VIKLFMSGVLKMVKSVLGYSYACGCGLYRICLVSSWSRTYAHSHFREIKSEDKSYRHFILPHRMEVASLLDVLGRFLGQQDRGLSVHYPGHHYVDKTGLWINIKNNNISTTIGHTGRIITRTRPQRRH
jgi:hypothetical protein